MNARRSDTDTVPVTVLTGFLGAGKTSLLNRILQANIGLRLAVIVNEIGEIDIDGELILTSDDDIVTLRNGCLCCTLRGDLVEALSSLHLRREPFDYVLIETTGIADPGPVAQTFLLSEGLKRWYTLDGIVTMVDARHFPIGIDNSESVPKQVAVADVVVLNKTDLVSANELDRVTEMVRHLNPWAHLIYAVFGDAPVDQLLGIRSFDLARLQLTVQGDGSLMNGKPHQHSTDEISSIAIELKGELNGARLYRWFTDLVALQGAHLYRMKGIVAVQGLEERVVFHGVHRVFDSEPGRPWGEEPRTSRIVFIGRHLDRDELVAGLRSCMATPDLGGE